MAKPLIEKAILIAGPTAGGKSAVALGLARALGGVIVNADAMQVYRDLKVLTARPDEEALAAVPHRLYGHVDAGERYSAGRWLGEAARVLGETAAAGRWSIVVGGTGLYFKALTEGLAPIPPADPAILERWRERLTAEGPRVLHAELARLDPAGAQAIRPSDSQRLVRALAVLATTGRPIAAFHAERAVPLIGRDVPRLVVLPDRRALYACIEARFDAMVSGGVLAEVEALLRRNLDPRLPAMKAIGVRELGRHLAGKASLADAMTEAKTHSRNYAKRQITWIRGQMAGWPVADSPEAALKLARTFAGY